MQRYCVIVSKAAESDIKAINQYITEVINNPFAASKIDKGIKNVISSLTFAPKRHKIGKNLYSLRYKKYRIVYVVEKKTVIVIGVVYARRKVDYWDNSE